MTRKLLMLSLLIICGQPLNSEAAESNTGHSPPNFEVLNGGCRMHFRQNNWTSSTFRLIGKSLIDDRYHDLSLQP